MLNATYTTRVHCVAINTVLFSETRTKVISITYGPLSYSEPIDVLIDVPLFMDLFA